ncbi:MAG: hypothetical protein HRT72_12720 [Flavobacteriales bacterium]|nr:hypothetical protein [Flavobacteriales bacterium]
MKIFHSLLFLITCSLVTFGQNTSYIHGGAKDEIAYSFCVNASGEYTIAGSTRSSGEGADDFLIINLSSNGGLNWEKFMADSIWM